MSGGMPNGAKFKAYERAGSRVLPKNTYAVIRFDGKNFSSFTRQFERPYDTRFMEAMDETTRRVCAFIPGAVVGYTQSDEISVVFHDLGQKDTQMWYNGKVDKMLSVGAATVTGAFLQALDFRFTGFPVFDARVHTLNDEDEVEEYIRWRRFDAQKNSITMAAGVLFSHRQLEGVSSKDRASLLVGTEFEVLPEGFYNGRLTWKETFMVPGHSVVQSAEKKAQPKTQPIQVARSRWVTVPATRDVMEQQFRSHVSV